MLQNEKTEEQGSEKSTSFTQAPSLAVAKGGGAISGIGEKFDVNPATGTGSMSIPLATSPGRSGYGPQLALSYNSGAGNGIFGLGWGLALPQITRKTDKGLPKYLDCTESDVFLLSGAEDLVPVVDDLCTKSCDKTGKNVVVREVEGSRYSVVRYRPRIESLFARIERWSNLDDHCDVHWRSYTKTNDLTVYGKDTDSRIADPKDPSRIFSWLICESRDTKGNAVLYEYKSEDGKGVDVCNVHERNRGGISDPRRTANRYIKRIRYGNRQTALDECGNRRHFLEQSSLDWMFEVVFDYGEHDLESPSTGEDENWLFREDPFSSYRSRFEVRTTRRCQRVLMFHHFPDEDGVGQDCLVRSTDFQYGTDELKIDHPEPVYSRIISVTQAGYKRKACGGYTRRTLPPLEFEYTRPVVQETIEVVDDESMQNLPIGLDGPNYRWVDLHGEGISGILTEQAGNWYYKPNLSPLTTDGSRSHGSPVESHGENECRHDAAVCDQAKSDFRSDSTCRQQSVARFDSTTVVCSKPNTSFAGGAQLLDLAGDGTPDLVTYGGIAAGFYEHEETSDSWKSFRTFKHPLNRNLGDPNTKFIDLSGDGRADLLITEEDSLVWHESEGEAGFADQQRVAKSLDEETGPRVVFADAEQSIYTADVSGDGLTDIVRIRNGEICYWPNIGYGHFGAKITMDNAPRFDDTVQFDHKRIRLADIDGSGTTDIIYLHRDGVQMVFNQSGNSWSEPRKLNAFPKIDNLNHIVPLDLLGNGTTCLVWSSPLLSDSDRPMRYINLMGGTKPHLLIKSKNNLGSETEVQYVPSTKFYLQDKRDGKPWVTRLPFPVHVVERVITRDRISGNRFVSRYAYHHGYFDGKEREFRGFGMVERFDTEEFSFLRSAGEDECPSNIDKASHVPPVLTRTWFHTGANLGRNRISNYFAGFLNEHDRGEYYREPSDCCSDEDAKAALALLPDTILPCDLTFAEEHEACRALKGSMLRQEVYALDGKDVSCEYPFGHPYTVTEQNFTVRKIQSKGDNRHGVFFTHPREVISYHYERNPVDPRISHALTLEVDKFGNVRKEASVAYGRRKAIVEIDRFGRKRTIENPQLKKLEPFDQSKQVRTRTTFTENQLTNSIDRDDSAGDHYLTPQLAGADTYELTGVSPKDGSALISFDHWARNDFAIIRCADNIAYESNPELADHQKRLIESVRTLYRNDDLSGLLPYQQIEPRMLVGESYKLAFSSGLIKKVFQRTLPTGDATEDLLSNPAEHLAIDPNLPVADRGGYVDLNCDGNWWIPSGRTYLSPDKSDSSDRELEFAKSHFFLDRRYRDPFHSSILSTETIANFDVYDMLIEETRDPVGNTSQAVNDYRVLQPRLVVDSNENRSEVAFDALGMVVGTAVMGKTSQRFGDSFDDFETDLSEETELLHIANPHDDPHAILGSATTRLIYDLFAFHRTAKDENPQPTSVYTIVRETHESDLNKADKQQTKVQHSFSYSDGFGREFQKKAQAEPGCVPLRGHNNEIELNEHGQPLMGNTMCAHRWVASGWTVFNNKGKPVRKFEPFFTDSHSFESDVCVGVSPILFYDPVERMIATIHPNGTFEKATFDPWRQTTWDVNDTVTLDPRLDPDVSRFVEGWAKAIGPNWKTWLHTREDDSFCIEDVSYSPIYDDVRHPKKKERLTKRILQLETDAAEKASGHSKTPTTAYLDSLGRTFLTVTHNRVKCKGHESHGSDELYTTRVAIDIEGNQRSVRDSIVQDNDQLGRIIVEYDYDMLGNRIRQSSMEAGERWTLNDITGKPIRSWDSRGSQIRSEYDVKRRPIRTFVSNVNEHDGKELLTDRLVYGEQHPDATRLNLRGKAYLQLDQAGGVSTEQVDFKGNPLFQTRRIAKEYKDAFGWELVDAEIPTRPVEEFDIGKLETAFEALFESETFQSGTTFDAMSRPIEMTTPHTDAMKPSVIRHRFNEANLLDRVEANIRQAKIGDKVDWTLFVDNIDYDAKGQRQRIRYGNGVVTTYDYDPQTFRLQRMQTRRFGKSFDSDSPIPELPDRPGEYIQNLNYTYDPVGNITHIHDDAQQTIFFRNKRVEPSNDYTYDAIYRLIEATGREHLGQDGRGAPLPHSHDDGAQTGMLLPGDGKAMGTYVERYVYDSIGNFEKMQHRGPDPQHKGWTRSYEYNESSLIEPSKRSNRLSLTQIRSGNPANEKYSHDIHGNMTSMPHLDAGLPDENNMHWDYQDQLKRVDLPGDRKAHYTYDAEGQRVRKVIWKSDGYVEERLYLGGFEIYRKRDAEELLERESLHIMDEQQRVALVETRTADTADKDKSPVQLIRYQHNNHLDSVSFELDQRAQLISHEEYTPFGSSSYRALRSETEVQNRYRFTGKERDEESGLYYHGFRFYAPWLGRWTSTDPIGIEDHKNLYVYTRCNPINSTDPTGLISWRKVAVVAAAITVGVAVSVVTAGAAAPLVAAAASSAAATLGATGAAAATVAGTVAAGAAAGAASSFAADVTVQAMTNKPGQGIDWNQAKATGVGGGVAGGVMSIVPGLNAARAVSSSLKAGGTVANGFAAARTATAATGSIGKQLTQSTVRGMGAGALGGGIEEGVRQIASGESLDSGAIFNSTVTGGAFGGVGAAVGTGARAGARNWRVQRAAKNLAKDSSSGRKAAAAVHEPASGKTIAKTNNPIDPKDLHPLLQERSKNSLAKHSAEDPRVKGQGAKYNGVVGDAHAEVLAVSEALFARENALGRAVGDSDLGDLLLDVVRTDTNRVGQPFSLCAGCSSITEGVVQSFNLSLSP